jgi:hypothetical protein
VRPRQSIDYGQTMELQGRIEVRTKASAERAYSLTAHHASLLAQLMACFAPRGRLVEPMAIHTPFHRYGLLKLNGLLSHHVAMAAFAFDFGNGMFFVAEEYKIGYFVEAARRNLPLGHFYVTHSALLHRRKTCQVRTFRILVARHTLQL